MHYALTKYNVIVMVNMWHKKGSIKCTFGSTSVDSKNDMRHIISLISARKDSKTDYSSYD